LASARAEAEGFFSWLPDPIGDYAIEAIALLIVVMAVIAWIKSGAEIWQWARACWRRLRGGAAPPDVAKRTESKVDQIHALLTAQAEQSGESASMSAIERAVAAAQEVLSSNDPTKAEARDAFNRGDLQAAESALARAYEREAADATRLDDQATMLKANAARTAREKAALAATRSAAEALDWYRKAAELVPEDFRTQVELSRLCAITGDTPSALTAGEAALAAADTERDRSVALNEIGDVRVAQGDLAAALASFEASLAIFERLAGADASNAGLQRDLSVSHERIGDLREARDDVAGAVEAYEASLAIAQPLAERLPDHPQFRSDLEITLRRLAELRAKAAG
jgi:tetratricopeptide (TPR) repeat protein